MSSEVGMCEGLQSAWGFVVSEDGMSDDVGKGLDVLEYVELDGVGVYECQMM